MSKLKEVKWLGSSLANLKEMPEEVQDSTGFILDRAQRGLSHPRIKVFKGLSGVREIRVDFDKDTYRTIYVVNLGDYLYVLHAFKKKSKKGISIPKVDIDLLKKRLKIAKEDAKNEENKNNKRK